MINCTPDDYHHAVEGDSMEFECSPSMPLQYDFYRIKQQHQHHQQFSSSPSASKHRNVQNVLVTVGGEAFSFPQWAFQKFLGLPWQCIDGTFSLNSSAAVFEVLLDYTLFGTMPAYDTLSSEEFQEFETMALAMGGLTALIEHFDRKDSYLAKELRQRNSSTRSRRSSRHFIINPEDSNSPSPNSISATRCARFLGALCGAAELITRRRITTAVGATAVGATAVDNGPADSSCDSGSEDAMSLVEKKHTN